MVEAHAICRQIAYANRGILGCWVLNLDSKALIHSEPSAFSPPTTSQVAALTTMMRSRLHGDSADESLEITISAVARSYFIKVCAQCRLGVILVADASVSLGIAWATLRKAANESC